MKQSRIESAIEQVCSVGSGFILAWLCWYFVVIPMIDDGTITYTSTTTITIIFTVLSVLRGYVWRRLFDKKLPHRIVEYFKKSQD